jgi:uncharacterized protein with GYD domain
MKFIILGQFEGLQQKTDWVQFMGNNHEQASKKCDELGIVIENVYVTVAGPCQFVVAMECPSSESMLTFQAWYNKQGRGSFEAFPAFDLETALGALEKS